MKNRKLMIKTITCHNVYNVGASLQAYALSKYLTDLGHQVEIIDYKPEYLKHYELWGVRNPKYNKPILREIYNILKLPGRIKGRMSKRKKSFDAFTKTYLPVTSKTYHNNDELKQDCPKADIFIAGSDQIWNTLFQNGKDPAFYMDFAASNAIRASYAASFATDTIADEYKKDVSQRIKNIDFVSVREESAIKILEDLGVDNATHVMDPVFLLSKEQWNTMSGEKISDEKYLFIYDFDNNEKINDAAVEIARKNDWKIYSLFSNNICDKSFFDVGPLEFVNLIKNAQMVLSNSFHAVAFSIIFEKQFVVYNRHENINSRMRDLLKSLDIVNGEGPIDYNKVNERLSVHINRSKNYLNSVILSAGKE